MVAKFTTTTVHMRGVICLAQNNQSTDYVRLAYLQRLSLKLTNPAMPYALVTDQASADAMSAKQRETFDHVIVLPVDHASDQTWKQRNDWQLFELSPFKQNIKVESDLLFVHDISHWWRALQSRDVVLSQGCKTYQGHNNHSRKYRYQFDINHLPDTYSGLMYWRHSHTAAMFFSHCKKIYANWDQVKNSLVQCDDPGSNDMVFALAAMLTGIERVTLPTLDFFNFVHMKSGIQGQSLQQFNIETVPPIIRVNGHQQQYPFHYHDKDWATDQLISKYENCT